MCGQLFSSIDGKDDPHTSKYRRVTPNSCLKSTLSVSTEAVLTQVVQKHVESWSKWISYTIVLLVFHVLFVTRETKS